MNIADGLREIGKASKDLVSFELLTQISCSKTVFLKKVQAYLNFCIYFFSFYFVLKNVPIDFTEKPIRDKNKMPFI